MKTVDVWRQWPLGVAEFAWKNGAFDSSPALNTCHKSLEGLPSKSYQRRIVISAIDANTGSLYFFNNDNTEFGPDLARAAISSAAMPFVFAP
jgi:predicted acylesterase/phospholipase RssA